MKTLQREMTPRENTSNPSAPSDYYCDRVAATSMGKYSTQVEGSFIEESLMLHLTKGTLIFDAGGGTG